MKALLRMLCSPILSFFEKGDSPYVYRSSQRKILLAVGALFGLLCLVSFYFGRLVEGEGGAGALIPAGVFFLVSLVCFVVGGLGTERAVARLWGSK